MCLLHLGLTNEDEMAVDWILLLFTAVNPLKGIGVRK